MSLNLFVHGVLAALAIWWLGTQSWRQVLKNWPSERRWIRLTIAGLLLVSIASLGLVILTGPGPWQYLVLPGGLYILAITFGRWYRRAH